MLLGEQSLAVQCGEILLREGHRIAAVVSDDPGIARWSRGHSLRVLPAGVDLVREMAGETFDYLLSITNLRILPDAWLALPAKMAINFHDGPLPRYAGLNAPAWALINGESEYGVSFHEMRREIDEGALLVQRSFEIAPDETSLTLNTKCFEAGIDAFAELVSGLATGSLTPRAQDLSGKSYFGRHDRPAAAAFLDWRRPAPELAALVRALDFGDRYENPLAAAKLEHAGRVAVALSAERVDDVSGAPGTAVAVDAGGITVACGEGALRVTRLASVFGEALAPDEAARLLAVSEGTTLDVLDDEAAALRSELSRRLAPNESFWLRRLARLESADVPHLPGAAPEAGAGSSGEVPVPEALQARGADAVVAAVAAWLGRLGGQARFHLAYRDAALERLTAGREAWLSPVVPLLVRTSPDVSVGAFRDELAAELARVRERGTWLHDAVGRTPALAASGILARGGLTRVGLEIGDLEAAPTRRPGLELLFRVHPDGSRIRIDALDDARGEAGTAALASRLRVFLLGLARAGDGDLLGRVPLLSAAERERALREWNDTAVDHPADRCVHELFALQAARTPDAEAVVFQDAAYSYRELDVRSNRLAHHLRERGVGPDGLVGIYVDRASRHARRHARRAEGGRRLRAPRSRLSRRSHRADDRGFGARRRRHPGRSRAAPARTGRPGGPHRRRVGRHRTPPGHLPAVRRHARESRLRDLHLGLDRPTQGRDGRAPQRRELLRRHGRAGAPRRAGYVAGGHESLLRHLGARAPVDADPGLQGGGLRGRA